MLDQGLDARDEDPGPTASPGREGRDARCGLVGDKLAPFVGEGRSRLEDGHGSDVTDPGREFLRHAITDLRVAGDPQDPLPRRQDECGREIALGSVGNLGQARVRCGAGGREIALGSVGNLGQARVPCGARGVRCGIRGVWCGAKSVRGVRCGISGVRCVRCGAGGARGVRCGTDVGGT